MKSFILAGAMALAAVAAQADTKVVMLGTGTPVPNPDRAGAGVAVIHDGEAYVFDIGGGVVQRMIEAAQLTSVDAAQAKGIKELAPTNVNHLFITHLHSDHTLDYAELASTLWWRRDDHLNAIGPKGLQAMTDGFYNMQKVDIDLRTGGNQPVKDPTMYRVNVTEIAEDGIVFDQDGVTVEAFSVSHGDIDPAYGYRITTPDKSVVISGDTTYSETLAEKAKGADVLIHEVISEEGWSALSPSWQEYHHTSHTLTSEVAKIANAAQPGVLVLTHVLHYGAPIESAKSEVETLYDGKVVLASDLDGF